MDSRVPYDAAGTDVVAACLELGLHQQHCVGARGEAGQDRRDGQAQGDEAEVCHQEAAGFGQEARIPGAEVHLLHGHYAGIAAQLPVELVGAHVHGVDPGGPPLQQAIREAAGAGASVEADSAGGIDAPKIQGPGQLQPTPAHEGQRVAPQADGGRLVDGRAGLSDGTVLHQHIPGEDAGLGLGPGLAKAQLDKQEVQPQLSHGPPGADA